MAFIDIFKIANNATELQVTATAATGSNFTQVLLWTEDTYKDYTQALDFTSKLSGTLGCFPTITESREPIRPKQALSRKSLRTPRKDLLAR